MPPQPPKLRYRLTAGIMVPVLVFTLIFEAGQMLFFGFIVGVGGKMMETAKETAETVEGVLSGVEAAFFVLSAVSIGACVVSLGVGCVGTIFLKLIEKAALKVVKYFVTQTAKDMVKLFVKGAVLSLSLLATMVSWLFLFGFYMLVVLLLSLRGIFPWDIWRKNPGITAAMLAVESFPYVGLLVPTYTIWLWRVWRRTRREDEERHRKALAEWEKAVAAYQAQMQQQLQAMLAAYAQAKRQAALARPQHRLASTMGTTVAPAPSGGV